MLYVEVPEQSTVQTVAPAELAASLDDFKALLKYSANDYDATLLGHLMSSIEYCQSYQWAQYCTATFAQRFDRFPSPIDLSRNPVQSVSSVQYVDTGGATQTLTVDTDYTVDIYSKPGRVAPAYGKWWPPTRGHLNDVIVTYVAGYGAASDVPQDIKLAIFLRAAAMFESCDMDARFKACDSLLDLKTFRGLA